MVGQLSRKHDADYEILVIITRHGKRKKEGCFASKSRERVLYELAGKHLGGIESVFWRDR